MKRWIALTVIILGLYNVFGCSKKEDGVVKIGAIIPLTGDAANYGTALKRGMDLAINETNKQGGIEGKKLIVIYEDDRNLPSDGVNAYNKLKNIDKVPMVIGAMFSSVTLAIAPIAEKDHIVLLSPTSSVIELTNAGDYIFRIYPSDSYDGEFLANFAVDKLRAKKIAIVGLQASSTISVSKLFKDTVEKKDAAIVSEDGYKEGTSDFRSILVKIKNQQQDIVFLPGSLKETSILLRQSKELGVKTKFLGISTFYDPKLIELASGAAEGLMFSSPTFDPTSGMPEVVSFVSAYKAKYQSEPDILGGYGYDAVNVAISALKKTLLSSSQITSDGIKNALYNIKNYKGITGEMSFDTNGDVLKELRMVVISDGKFKVFDTIR